MKPEIVIAAYRPKPDRQPELDELVSVHGSTLRARGLATDRPTVLMRARDGTILEIFEWVSAEAATLAHSDPEVASLWERMEDVCDFIPLSELAEARSMFPHFQPIP